MLGWLRTRSAGANFSQTNPLRSSVEFSVQVGLHFVEKPGAFGVATGAVTATIAESFAAAVVVVFAVAVAAAAAAAGAAAGVGDVVVVVVHDKKCDLRC